MLFRNPISLKIDWDPKIPAAQNNFIRFSSNSMESSNTYPILAMLVYEKHVNNAQRVKQKWNS